MMEKDKKHEKNEYDFGLGTGYEPLAVGLMILFIWIFFVSFISKFFI